MVILQNEVGSATGAAARLGWDQSQWSNLKNGAADSKTGKPRGMHKDTARKIEKAFGRDKFWLDIDHSARTNTESRGIQLNYSTAQYQVKKHGKITDQDEVIIPQYDAGGSMGNGLILDGMVGIIKSWHVDQEWLRLNVRRHTGVNNLCIVTGFGPSMQPMFNPGDPLLVDRGVKEVDSDAVYFFRVDNHGYIKTIQRIPTADGGIIYRAKSKNPDYDSFDIVEGMDFEVFGKVLTIWKSEQF